MIEVGAALALLALTASGGLYDSDAQGDQVTVNVEMSTAYRKVPTSTAPDTERYRRIPVFLCLDAEAQRSAEIAATCAAVLTLGELPECTDDEILLDPLFVSTRDNETTPWSTCADVPDTATTTSTSNPLDVLELTPRLVTDPLTQY
ncbi:hypothetical protein SAMN04489860_2567 [Paraoerskovia marina]|uniref:Uncharacterized protein n=1 Tax=Paraoerskovia marina TaxID=545619 RepID=A0A1H1VPC0_9CELL|nr:hypothetical protein [Paraoerskovia marina]SDS86593.1 hypothetical protein SAMN04489860_2567 [Paraoerskovia marina]